MDSSQLASQEWWLGSCVLSTAPSAFMASAVGTCNLQDMILSKCDTSVDSAVGNVLDQWTIAHGQSDAVPPVSSASAKQEWDEPSIATDIARLNASLPDRHH